MTFLIIPAILASVALILAACGVFHSVYFNPVAVSRRRVDASRKRRLRAKQERAAYRNR